MAGQPILSGEPITLTLTGILLLLKHATLHTLVEAMLQKMKGVIMKAKPILTRIECAIPKITKKVLLHSMTLVIVAI